MPWQLATPLNVGDLDSADYDQVRILDQRHDSERALLSLMVQYGRDSDGTFIPGKTPRGKEDIILIQSTEYNTIVGGSVPDVQTADPANEVRYVQVGSVWVERTYSAVKRGLYAWLATHGHIEEGSVV